MDIQVTIKNFGKIKDAKLSIKDLTVFAGNNSTGKSYASRVLYCMFDALRDPELHYYLKNVARFEEDLSDMVEEDFFGETKKARALSKKTDRILDYFLTAKVEVVAKNMDSELSNHHPEEYEGLVEKYFIEIEKLLREKDGLISKLSEVLGENKDKSTVYLKSVSKYITHIENSFRELEGAIKKGKDKTWIRNSAYRDRVIDNLGSNFQLGSLRQLIGSDKKKKASVVVQINKTGGKIYFDIDPQSGKLNATITIKNPFALSDVMYLETPAHWKLHSTLSWMSFRRYVGGRRFLGGVPKYVFDAYSKLGLEIAEQGSSGSAEEPLTGLSNKIKRELGGEIVYDSMRRRLSFVEDGDNNDKQNKEELSLHLTATGIVQLGILGYFIKNNIVDKGTILFIDEPEAHLHTEWQEVMMGVLYQLKEIGVKVILATHSPTIMQKLEIEVNDRKQKDEVALNLFKGDGQFGGDESTFDEIDGEIASSMNEAPYRMFIGTTINGQVSKENDTEKK